MLVVLLHLAVMLDYCFAINVPDVYQESILRRYRSYSDVSIFHYYVPSQVSRATWEFAAFMDDPSCIPREVYIHIQAGTYPVVNPYNASFPDNVLVDTGQQYVVQTMTKFQSHDALVFHAFNPAPGSWFAVAYIPDWNFDIGQQGLSHKCRYSLGSIASWSQNPDVMLLTPHVPTIVDSSSQFTFFKVYVPENIWLLEVSITNCTVRSSPGIGSDDVDSCAQGFGLQADSLPFPSEVNISTGGDAFVHTQPQPRTQTYHYLLVSANNQISFTVSVNMKECVYVWGSGLFQESASTDSATMLSSLAASPSPAPLSFNSSDQPPPTTETIPLSAINSTLSSRHSNRSVSQDWHDAMMSVMMVHGANRSHVAVSTNISAAAAASSTTTPTIRSAGSAGGGSPYLEEEETTVTDQECLPMISMARIKHAQDFTDSFLLQGKDRYTSLLGVSDSFPVVLKMELLPFVDIGGTLQIGTRLVEPPMNMLDQVAVIRVCISHGQPPLYNEHSIQCNSQLEMQMATGQAETEEAVKYFPFPRPGQWFISFETKCYADSTIFSLNRNSTDVPCHFDMLMVYVNFRVQPCLFEGSPCGEHGVCEENHRGQFFFSTCRCLGGWRGWGCTDGSHATPQSSLLTKTLLLTLSNIFFIPPIVLAIRRKFFAEAVVYGFTMFFSTFYHACDEDLFAFCLMKYEVLQFCDFYSAILSFWVTLIAMANLSSKVVSIFHMIGALGIALGVEYQRTGLWVFIVPVGTGLIIMMSSWGKHCRQTRSCYPSRLSWVVSFLPGTILATTGLCMFAFVETESNYKYVHSVWHVIMALSIVFLLPQPTDGLSNGSSCFNSGNAESAGDASQHPMDDSELMEVSDYANVTSDFQQLLH